MEKTYSLYIHIPFCISKCRYCDFFSLPCGNKEIGIPEAYVEALCCEISSLSGKALETIYVGGGTPSLLTTSQIKRIFDCLYKNCSISESAEINFEVNPDDVSEELLKALEAAGVNRLSCGIQSMNEEALKFSGRRADAAVNRRALELLSRYWKKSLSLDFICGLPKETEESFLKGLDLAAGFSPDHISMYSLTIEDETPFGKDFALGRWDYNYDFADQLWLKGRDFLESKGYVQYEVSNFAKKGAQCRHNLVYWNHKDYFGIGSGATGTLYKENGEGLRTTNTTDVKKYISFWTDKNNLSENTQPPQIIENISIENSEFEFFMMTLRKTEGFNESDYRKCFKKSLSKRFLELFDKWQKKGLAEKTGNGQFYLNKEGLLFLNSFLSEL